MTWIEVQRELQRRVAAAKADGITQAAIAERGGLAGQNVLSYMLSPAAGRRGPSITLLLQALEGLQVDPAEFFHSLTIGGGGAAATAAAAAAQKGHEDHAHSPTPVVAAFEARAAAIISAAVRQAEADARRTAARLERLSRRLVRHLGSREPARRRRSRSGPAAA